MAVGLYAAVDELLLEGKILAFTKELPDVIKDFKIPQTPFFPKQLSLV